MSGSVVSGVSQDRAVVMTVSADRPRYLEQTLESWRAVRGLPDWSFIFAVEPGPHAVECARLIARSLEGVAPAVILNQRRLGVLRNPHFVLGRGFERVRYTVLAEEDVLVSNDVLEFFDAADRSFFADPEVLAVCASSWPGSPGDSPVGWRKLQGFNPLVWATWRDRWETILRDTWDLDYSTGLPDGSQAGWDWNIGRLLRFHSLQTVFPDVSRSLHIGRHGVHMLEEFFKASQSDTFVLEHAEGLWKDVDAVQQR